MDVFGALADPVRRDLLTELVDGPRRVVDLASGQAISRPAVSRHLRILDEAGIVEAQDRGRERHYALRAAGLHPVAALLGALGHSRGQDASTSVLPGPAGRLAPQALDALETEVRRAGRGRRTTSSDRRSRTTPREETA